MKKVGFDKDSEEFSCVGGRHVACPKRIVIVKVSLAGEPPTNPTPTDAVEKQSSLA